MARFSVNGGDEIDAPDDGSGPSNRPQPRKKPKLTPTTTASAPPPPPPQPAPPPPSVVLIPLDEDEEDSEDAESYDEEDESDEEAAEEEESEQQQEQVGANEEASVDELASYDRKLTFTLTLTDPDVLDCPLCYENLKIPVFQCENGHITCASCCVKLRNKCASCSFPTGYNRCRAIEKVLEASQVTCKNAIYGCKTTMKYYVKQDHERECLYSPCSCPALNCNFVNSKWNVYNHFQSKHSFTNFNFTYPFSVSLVKLQSYLFLREETIGTIFVLNQFTVRQGRAASIVQIAPKLSGTKSRYELKIKDGETSLTLKSTVECVPKLVDYRPTKHFLVVEDSLGPLERATLDICISPGY